MLKNTILKVKYFSILIFINLQNKLKRNTIMSEENKNLKEGLEKSIKMSQKK